MTICNDLRASVLQAAIQGKLVEQRPEEGTGEELYRQIQKEKQALIKAGKIKKEKPLPEIAEDEKPFDIPESWKWVRLGGIVSVYGGKRIPAGRKLSMEDTGYTYIRVSDMKDGYVSTENLQYVPQDIYPSISRYIINKEDVFITVAGTIGRVGKIPPELDGANLTENADRLVFSDLDQDWLIKCLQSSVVQNQIADATTKVGQPKLAIVRIQNMIIPLPPLAEQKRIVAHINEIMSKIDELEKIEKELDELKKAFPGDMKAALLQAAIQGKLTKQVPEDGTVEALYQQIQSKKQALIKAGKIKKEKPLPEIAEDEKPFDIPESWKWVRMNSVISLLSGSDLSPNKYNSLQTGIPYITGASNIENGNVIINRWTEYPNNIAVKGNLLLTCKGTVGKTAILKESEVHIARQLMSVTPIVVDIVFVKYFIESQVPSLKSQAKSMIPGIERNSVLNLPFPLPPLAEQKRIVEKLDWLLPLVEGLAEEKLAACV